MNINKLVQEIKDSMRFRHDALDKDIKNNINAALQDMKLRGISVPKKEDNLVKKACELYCKSQCDYLGVGERFERSYESLRDSMSLSEDYHGKE